MADVLFVDDDPQRHKKFRSLVPSATLCRTVESAVDFLGNGRKWDVVLLDHDMGGEPYQDSGEYQCGMEIVRFLEGEEDRPEVGLFVVHSLNPPAAQEMTERLSALGYAAMRMPFFDVATGEGIFFIIGKSGASLDAE